MSYEAFAKYYDRFTSNINYEARADYFLALLKKHDAVPGTILDLACGTGSLSLELVKRGVSVTGVDASEEMLAMASAKMTDTAWMLLHQKMEKLELPEPVGAAICALDSLNHLPDESALAAVFRRLSFSLKPGGYFLFDVNTRYKMEQVLADNAFVFEDPPVFCVWQNSYFPEEQVVEIQLDFFEQQKSGSYLRWQEQFEERFFAQEVLEACAAKAGFDLIGVYGEDSFAPPQPQEQRLIYLMQWNRKE